MQCGVCKNYAESFDIKFSCQHPKLLAIPGLLDIQVLVLLAQDINQPQPGMLQPATPYDRIHDRI